LPKVPATSWLANVRQPFRLNTAAHKDFNDMHLLVNAAHPNYSGLGNLHSIFLAMTQVKRNGSYNRKKRSVSGICGLYHRDLRRLLSTATQSSRNPE
jgi:hypothetical protein